MRWVCEGRQVHIDWPRLGARPDFGLTRSRHDFDEILAGHAREAGARLHTHVKATEPVTDRAGRITGLRALAGADKQPKLYRAPVVIAADGASARTALAMGLQRDPSRQVATAARRYYRSATRTDDPYLELWADLLCSRTQRDLPGYGWIFPLGDGRVNVGLGALARRQHGSVDLRATMEQWLARLPQEWGLREENADSPWRSAALPMGFNRRPQYSRGMLLVGDSAGMVSPWSGEGIGQAMEAGEAAADIVALAMLRPTGPAREEALRQYPREIQRRWGTYYRIGNSVADLVLRRYGYRPLLNRRLMASPVLVRFLARTLTYAADETAHDAVDTVLRTLLRLVPAPDLSHGTRKP